VTTRSSADSLVDPFAAVAGSSDGTESSAIDCDLDREAIGAALFAAVSPPRVGPFTVGARLGAGASSVVYAAWDDELERRVAVKIFVAKSPAARQQVQREARALARLSHPNIVHVYEVGEWRGRAFIAMELIAGTTLACWQTAANRTTTELLDAYLQAGRGLAAAHRVGLVHRDFKPSNVMVATDGRVVVTDFGLAGSAVSDGDPTGAHGGSDTSSTTTRAGIGTPAYVAPEQRRGATPHPSADIYSFAIALCEALLGWHPMREPEAVWQRALARRVPRRLHRALRVALSGQPSARGDTLDALLEALAPARRRPRRGRAVLAVVGFAALALAGGLAYVSRDGHRLAPPRRALTPPFRAPSLPALVQQVDHAVASPPTSGDDHAAAALRALVLAPLPAEIRCEWPAPLVAFAFTDDHAVGLDGQGRVHACALRGGAMSLVATRARCIVAGPAGTIGMFADDLQLHVVRATGGGWRPVPIVSLGAALPLPGPDAPCKFDIVLRLDGSAQVTPWAGFWAAGHRGPVVSVVPAGLQIVARDGAVVASYPLAHMINTRPLLAISRDGARVAAAGTRGPLVSWDARTGWRDEPLHFDSIVQRLRSSPSGTRVLLISFFGGLEVRHLGGGTAQWLSGDSISDAVFLDDDTVIASDVDRRLWRYDLAAQRAEIVAVHTRAVWSATSNAEVLATGGEDGMVTVTDRRTGQPRHELRVRSDVYKILLDGSYLLAAGNDGVRIWDWRSGVLVSSADSDGLRIWDLVAATAGDGTRRYLSGALERSAIFAWDARSERLVSSSVNGRISDLAVSADGRTAAAVDSGGRLIAIDVATMRVTSAVAAAAVTARAVAFDPVTAAVVTIGDDGYLRTWTLPELAPRSAVPISSAPLFGLDVLGGRAVTAGSDGVVTLIDLARGAIVRRYRGHSAAVRTVRFRSDGAWFVTGGRDARACLWRVDQGECHTWLDGHSDDVLGASFVDDDTIVTASQDGTVRSWRPTYDQALDAVVAELARRGSRR
jgi:serine/threonine protein kinase/WD40 repeat protein